MPTGAARTLVLTAQLLVVCASLVCAGWAAWPSCACVLGRHTRPAAACTPCSQIMPEHYQGRSNRAAPELVKLTIQSKFGDTHSHARQHTFSCQSFALDTTFIAAGAWSIPAPPGWQHASPSEQAAQQSQRAPPVASQGGGAATLHNHHPACMPPCHHQQGAMPDTCPACGCVWTTSRNRQGTHPRRRCRAATAALVPVSPNPPRWACCKHTGSVPMQPCWAQPAALQRQLV